MGHIQFIRTQMMNYARFFNKIARIFNDGYWSVADLEHFRPAEYYITGP